jgi:CheY-like chemotaxis protein
MDGEKALEIGASGYLEKPHEKLYLANMVRKVLDEKKK